MVPICATTISSMDPKHGQDACAEGWRLLEAGKWDAARQAFETAMSAEPTPDACDGLGYALNYLGRTDEGIATRALAFEEYLKAGRCDDAARVAVWVSHAYVITGQPSARARGCRARSAPWRARNAAWAKAGSPSSGPGMPRPATSAPGTRGAQWRSHVSAVHPTSRSSRSACSAAAKSAPGAARRG